MKKYFLIVIAALMVCLALPAFGANVKLSRDLREQVADKWMDVIIQFDSTVATDLDKDSTGVRRTVHHDMFSIGAGYVDLSAAIASTTTVPAGKTAASPLASLNTATNPISLVYSSSVVWGDAILANNVIRSSSVVWGDSTLTCHSVVWGD